jgi:mRNA-degrading endonuclease RelE of RelBE toxin-antitoxin system
VVYEIDDAGRIVIVLVAGDRKDIYKRAKRRLT